MASVEPAQVFKPDQAVGEKLSVDPVSEQPANTDVAYSVFSTAQKKTIVLAASLGAVFSPMSTTIYLPALNQIADDLHVSSAKINLTVTTFLVCYPMSIRG